LASVDRQRARELASDARGKANRIMSDKSKQTKASNKVAPAHGFDGAGHMDPAHAARLRELARQGKEAEADAFVESTGTKDDLAEELGEAAVANMTSGEDQLGKDLEAEVDEDNGGPFVETSGNTEFAGGTDESNIPEATREPFPKT
jgi:hypothetical protein